MNNRELRWGIIGPGSIAERFALSMQRVEGATIRAVASRNEKRANAFAERYSIPIVCHSYDELWNRDDIDVIYISTPHIFHYEQCIKSIQSGKAVLCEKPLSLNEKMSQALFDFARSKNVFLMEAMWSPFTPVVQKVKEWIKAGKIGDLQLIQSTFGFQAPYNTESRLFKKALAGGATLDISIYNIALSNWLFDSVPHSIKAHGFVGKTGVDEATSVDLDYGAGRFSQYQTSFLTSLPNEMHLAGSAGRIKIGEGFWALGDAELFSENHYEKFCSDVTECGFEYEIQHVIECINQGKLTSDLISPAFTCNVAGVMDKVLAQLGVEY